MLRWRPSAILLIDGLFETVGAVWHKELAVALERGVPVVGASSMGALRAAEMGPLGMVGVGWVFEQYRDGAIVDDDEVAVLQNLEGSVLTDAMVNLRRTADEAVEHAIVSRGFADEFVARAKARFYPDRILRDIATSIASHEAERFVAWSESGGYVNIKALDAEQALVELPQWTRSVPAPAISVPRTVFLCHLHREVHCVPFHTFVATAPWDEAGGVRVSLPWR